MDRQIEKCIDGGMERYVKKKIYRERIKERERERQIDRRI